MSNNKEVKKLSANFLDELIYCTLHYRRVIKAMLEFFRFEYVPVKLIAHKKILHFILDYYKKSTSQLTIGVLKQQFIDDEVCNKILDDINKLYIKSDIPILESLEAFIKRSEFAKMYKEAAELYNEEKVEQGLDLLTSKSKDINSINILNKTSSFSLLYRDWSEGIYRVLNADKITKISTPLEQLDQLLGGGMDIEDTVLIMGPTNIGKSISLRSFAFHAHMLNYRVLHIQCEGSQNELHANYTRMWTTISFNEIVTASLSEEEIELIEEKANVLAKLHPDMCLKSFERFDFANMYDVRDAVFQYEEEFGYSPDLIVIDSLDLINPDNTKYSSDAMSQKLKMHQTSRLMKNLALEKKCVIVTATQCSKVPANIRNNPERYITSEHLEFDKTLGQAFSIVMSLNQTEDEYNENLMRIYVEKIRNHRKFQRVLSFVTAFDQGQLVNYKATEEYLNNLDNDD